MPMRRPIPAQFEVPHLNNKDDYCKNCDFLWENSEVLVWSNDKSAKLKGPLGFNSEYIRTDYIPKK